MHFFNQSKTQSSLLLDRNEFTPAWPTSQVYTRAGKLCKIRKSCSHSLRRVPHQGYGVVASPVQGVDWLLSPCSAPSPVNGDATAHGIPLQLCLQPHVPAGTSAVSFVGHAMSRVAARATSAAVVCQVLCLCPQLFKQCRLARCGQVQGAGEKSALPPTAGSGRPHVAQSCSIILMRIRLNGLFYAKESRVHSGCQVHVRAIPLGWLFLPSARSRDPGPRRSAQELLPCAYACSVVKLLLPAMGTSVLPAWTLPCMCHRLPASPGLRRTGVAKARPT